MRKKIAMKDIAKQLGVSTALVSYVLNDKFPDRINPNTAKRIKELAEELQYQPNHIAKSLKNSQTLTIGLIIADISNLFYSSIARVIEDAAKKYHYNMIFGSADENLDKFEELVQVFVNRQVDGIILAAPEGAESMLGYLQKQNIPFVLIDRDFPDMNDLNSIVIDNYKASYSVVEHLCRQGFRHPAMVTLASNLHHLQERSRGFSVASRELLGIKKEQIIEMEEDTLADQMEQVVLKLVEDEKTDSVYFSTNKIALEGLVVLARHKVKVPDSIGVICFDEAYAYNIFSTSITYVKQPLGEIGEKAVQQLLARMKGDATAQRIMLDTEIIEGNSSLRSVNKINVK
jgi:LacI family transcriptional regulator